METRLDAKCSAGHTLFYKQHDVRNTHFTKPAGRTLFVLNVPSYCDEVSILFYYISIKYCLLNVYLCQESLKTLFGTAGAIRTVMFEEKPSGSKEPKASTSLFAKKTNLVNISAVMHNFTLNSWLHIYTMFSELAGLQSGICSLQQGSCFEKGSDNGMANCCFQYRGT